MKKQILLLTLFSCLSVSILMAQAGDDRLAEVAEAAKEEVEEGWVKGGGLGLDFAQLALIKPRVGAGANRIGFGGLVTAYANYKKDKFAWSNTGSLQLAAQRIGGDSQPFEKNLDILRLNSRAGVQLSEGKWYAALEANAQTLLLPTYAGNVLKPEDSAENPIASFLSPIQIGVSPGIDYKHDEHLSVFFSPASLRLIYVANDDIAALLVHGNEEGSNSFLQLGANLKTMYANKFLEDRLTWSSTLDLYSNYLQNPQNIDLLWTNDLGWTLFKNFSINIVTELFYDDNVDVQLDLDDDGILGEAAGEVSGFDRSELAPSVSFTQALLIKYNFIF
jgi:hypothetical protein